ncbi:helix-turn-helix domain-containing protein [Flagellimonas sp.]|uniref:helix-turn-helix domain-containing protein n=1 Tax=Flagellimonas sp. TaxID=2058762 RepID=UPI003B50C011
MDDILMNIGKHLKQARQKRDMTLQQVALRAGVSAGLISKIENLRTTPSLPVLLKIMQTLSIDLSELDLTNSSDSKYVLVKNGEGEKEDREDSKNLEYVHLFSRGISDQNLRVYIVNVEQGADRKPISTDATELVYVIKGTVVYTLNDEALTLEEGDLLFFDGSIPHGVSNSFDQGAVLLKIYLVHQYKQ